MDANLHQLAQAIGLPVNPVIEADAALIMLGMGLLEATGRFQFCKCGIRCDGAQEGQTCVASWEREKILERMTRSPSDAKVLAHGF